jgi:hypothetical protein
MRSCLRALSGRSANTEETLARDEEQLRSLTELLPDECECEAEPSRCPRGRLGFVHSRRLGVTLETAPFRGIAAATGGVGA